jgi:hypothetical protein
VSGTGGAAVVVFVGNRAGGSVIPHGPLAQLVAHLHDTQGVVGSSPARPTRKDQVNGTECARGTSPDVGL